jgi:hypothetical protein
LDRFQALTIFNIPPGADQDEIREHFENEAFSLYSTFFTKDPVPALIHMRIKKLKQLLEGAETLLKKEEPVQKQPVVLQIWPDPQVNLNNYQECLSALRRDLSNAKSITEVIFILYNMISIRLSWDTFWESFTLPVADKESLFPELQEQVKLGENMDVLRLMIVLRSFGEGDTLVKLDNSQLKLVLQERIRSIKILANAAAHG